MLNMDALASGTDQGARDMRAHLSNIVRGSEPGADQPTIARGHVSATWMADTLRSAFGDDVMKGLDFYTEALAWARKRYGHDVQPHEAGTMYDCPSCASNCFCAELQADQITDAEDTKPEICVHCETEGEAQNELAQKRFGRRS